VPDFTFHPGNTLVLDGNGFGYGAAADLDNDGIDELIPAPTSYPEKRSNALPVISWTGTAFKDRTSTFLSSAPKSDAFTDVLVDDFNRDGRDDLFLGGFGYDDMPFPGSRDFLLLQTPGGKLKDQSKQVSGKKTTTYFSTSGDINRDGYPDILVLTLNVEKKKLPYFLVSGKSGKYAVDRNRLNPTYTDSGGDGPLTSAAIADFDNDGWNDLIVGREDGRYVGLYYNRKGSFRRNKPDVTLPKLALGKGSSHPLDIKALDFDLDGFMDIVVFSAGWPDFGSFSVQFFRNAKGKRFKDVTKSVLPGKPKTRGNLAGLDRLRMVDFHGDGLVDLVGVSEQGGESSTLVFLNDGSGRYSEHGWNFFRSDQGHGYRSLIPADLDGDGRTDLVTAYNVGAGAQSTYQFEAFTNDGIDDGDIDDKPKIIRQPQKRTVAKGKRLHLSALVRGDRPFTYRWTRNGAPIRNADGPVLEFVKAKKKHAGKYRVTVSNAAGQVMSKKAKVRIKKR